MADDNNSHKAFRGSLHSKKPLSKKSHQSKEKINLIIQLRDSEDKNILKIRVPSETKLGEIKKYISEKYGEDSNIIYMTHLNSDPGKTSSDKAKGRKGSRSKIDLIFKSSIGSENEEAKLRVPRNIRIGTLKDALASRFGLSTSDFELVHVD